MLSDALFDAWQDIEGVDPKREPRTTIGPTDSEIRAYAELAAWVADWLQGNAPSGYDPGMAMEIRMHGYEELLSRVRRGGEDKGRPGGLEISLRDESPHGA